MSYPRLLPFILRSYLDENSQGNGIRGGITFYRYLYAVVQYYFSGVLFHLFSDV